MGGWHANHAIDVIDAGGTRHRLVLRRRARPQWALEDPDFTAAREAAVLELLSETPIPAPRLVTASAKWARASFRTGPLELIGVDVNLAIAESFHRQSHGEPRWRPSPLQARLVAAGRHGRKCGHRLLRLPRRRSPSRRSRTPAPGGGDGRIVAIDGRAPVADALRTRAATTGFAARDEHDGPLRRVHLLVDADPERAVVFRVSEEEPRARAPATGAPRASTSLPPLDRTRLPETCAHARADPDAIERTEALLGALGFHVERVADAPGLLLVAQLVNEAAFAIGEGVGLPADVDAGTTLGLNHPRGPVAWSEAIGLPHVRAILRGLRADRGEERYRLAPMLTRSDSLAGCRRRAKRLSGNAEAGPAAGRPSRTSATSRPVMGESCIARSGRNSWQLISAANERTTVARRAPAAPVPAFLAG
jgi:3-hydroxyacyl-CoA dehydrogenase